MLAKRIIPCLDVKAGWVVKGVKFLELQDAGDPVGPSDTEVLTPYARCPGPAPGARAALDDTG